MFCLVLCSLFGLREATVQFENDVKNTLSNFIFGNNFFQVEGKKCVVRNTLVGLHYQLSIVAVVILNVAILFYLINCKYPREGEILNQQESNVERLHQLMQQRYRLMSHVSAHGSIPV